MSVYSGAARSQKPHEIVVTVDAAVFLAFTELLRTVITFHERFMTHSNKQQWSGGGPEVRGTFIWTRSSRQVLSSSLCESADKHDEKNMSKTARDHLVMGSDQ